MEDARALYKEGFDHFVGERLEAAIDCYRRAVAADPQLAIAWSGLAMALAQSGDLDGAIETGRRVVELEPEDPLAHTSLSIFLQRQGRIPEAEEERAIAMRLSLRDSQE